MKGVIQYSHFRFKEDSSNDDYVWRVSYIEFHPNTVSVSSCMFLFSLTLIIFYFCEQDIVSGEKPLPTYQNQLFAKIVRIDNEASMRRKIRLQRKKDAFWGNGATAATSMSSSSVAPGKTSSSKTSSSSASG